MVRPSDEASDDMLIARICAHDSDALGLFLVGTLAWSGPSREEFCRTTKRRMICCKTSSCWFAAKLRFLTLLREVYDHCWYKCATSARFRDDAI